MYIAEISSPSTSSTTGTSSLSPSHDSDQDTPRLVVTSGREILEYQRLDPASIAVSKMKAMVKGSAMGFKLYTLSSTPEIRKFQVKFRTTEDSARCASLLKQLIQCRNVLSTEGPDGPVIAAEPSTRIESNRASPPSPSLTLPLAQPAPSIRWNQSLSPSQSHQDHPLSITPRYGSQPVPVANPPRIVTTPPGAVTTTTLTPNESSSPESTSTSAMFAYVETPPSTPHSVSRPSPGLPSPFTPFAVEPPTPPLPSIPQEPTGDITQLLSLTPEDLARALENIARHPNLPTLIKRIEAIMRPRG
ncbi:hypothetical protein BG003_009445 [Podila horticola]|nr:hypothetical protein BG003_009445 [Podila horticola]